jgi:hypothetical protein
MSVGFSYKLQPFALPLPMIRASFGIVLRGVTTLQITERGWGAIAVGLRSQQDQ